VRHQHPALTLAPHAVAGDRDGEEEQQGGVILDGDSEGDLLRRVLPEHEGKPNAHEPDGGRHECDLGCLSDRRHRIGYA
jgi:hypothetical protein